VCWNGQPFALRGRVDRRRQRRSRTGGVRGVPARVLRRRERVRRVATPFSILGALQLARFVSDGGRSSLNRVQLRARVGVQGRPRVHGAAGAGPDGGGVAAGAGAALPCQYSADAPPHPPAKCFEYYLTLILLTFPRYCSCCNQPGSRHEGTFPDC
jgi:hypothetical protein